MTYDLVTTATALQSVVDELLDEPRYAVDTEFHRERTYFPKVALVQLAWPGRSVLVDPMAVSLEPLSKVLQGTGLAVLHASSQDLEVLDLVCGTTPSRLFDTQIAAGFLGYASASLASLCERALRIRLPKGDRLTDWLVRPLSEEQLIYAAADVDHLLAIHDWLLERLGDLGRIEWAEDECEDLRLRGRPERLPHDAWRRIKEARQLRGQAFDIARALAAWREERAVKLDQPVRFVLPDLALVALAQRAPRSAPELRGARGVDDRHVGGQVANEILAVIDRARNEPPPLAELSPQPELARDLRPVVPLITAWINQLATELDLDPALLGTRADVEAALRGDEGGRLSTGWRADLLGEPIHKLVGGHAALAYDAGRGLVLDDRRPS
ncbi:MAG TPA: ribonuclease D [Acidimicrobiales bacterium]|nr:ribonuclease D [Acidimicrobiales bacterium]